MKNLKIKSYPVRLVSFITILSFVFSNIAFALPNQSSKMRQEQLLQQGSAAAKTLGADILKEAGQNHEIIHRPKGQSGVGPDMGTGGGGTKSNLAAGAEAKPSALDILGKYVYDPTSIREEFKEAAAYLLSDPDMQLLEPEVTVESKGSLRILVKTRELFKEILISISEGKAGKFLVRTTTPDSYDDADNLTNSQEILARVQRDLANIKRYSNYWKEAVAGPYQKANFPNLKTKLPYMPQDLRETVAMVLSDADLALLNPSVTYQDIDVGEEVTITIAHPDEPKLTTEFKIGTNTAGKTFFKEPISYTFEVIRLGKIVYTSPKIETTEELLKIARNRLKIEKEKSYYFPYWLQLAKEHAGQDRISAQLRGGGAMTLLAIPLLGALLLPVIGHTSEVPAGQLISPPAISGQLVPGVQPEFALGGGQQEKAPAITIPSDAGWKAQDWVDSRGIEQVFGDRNQMVMSVRLYSELNFRKQLKDYLKGNPIAGFNPDNYREINDLVSALSEKVESMPSASQKLRDILEIGERTKGEAFIDLRWDDLGIPGWNRGSGVDLSKYKIQVTLEIPAGLPGANNAPNGVQIFLKSGGDWAGWYGGWTNIDSPGKMTVAVDVQGTVPNWVVPGFDAGKCVGLGVKLGTGGNAPADYQFQGQVRVLKVELIPSTISKLVTFPSPLPKITLQPVSPDSFKMNSGRNLNWGEETPYGYAVGSPDGYSKIMPNGHTRIYNALARVKAEGGGASRVWLFMDLRNWDQITEIKGGRRVLKPQVFKDIQALADAQRELGIKVVPCLYDFHILNGIKVERGTPVGEHPEFFTEKGLAEFTETMRPAYEMIAQAFDISDPMNEPGNTAPAAGTNLAFNPHIYTFLKATANEIHRAGGRVTMGASRPQDLAKYRDFIDVGQIHCYGVTIPNAGELGVGDMPVFIGEYGARTPQEAAKITKEAHSKGYFGVMFWDQDSFTADGLREGLNNLPKTTARPQQPKAVVPPQKAPATPKKTEVTQPEVQEAGVIEIDPAKFTTQGNEFYLDVSYGIEGLPSVSGERSGIDLRGYDLEFTFKGGRGEQAQIWFKNSSWANVYSYPRTIVPGQPIRFNPVKDGRNVDDFDDFSHIYAIGAKIWGGTEGVKVTKIRLIKRSGAKHSQVIPREEEQMDKFAQMQNYLKSAAENYRILQAEINSNTDLANDAGTQAKLKDFKDKMDYWARRCLEAGEKAGIAKPDIVRVIAYQSAGAYGGLNIGNKTALLREDEDSFVVADSKGEPHTVNFTSRQAINLDEIEEGIKGIPGLTPEQEEFLLAKVAIMKKVLPGYTIEIATYDTLIEDRLAFVNQRKPKYITLAFHNSLKDKPTGIDHEIGEFLVDIGEITLSLSGGHTSISIDYKDAGGETLFLSPETLEFIKEENWPAGWETKPHYLLRVWQREKLKGIDAALTQTIQAEQIFRAQMQPLVDEVLKALTNPGTGGVKGLKHEIEWHFNSTGKHAVGEGSLKLTLIDPNYPEVTWAIYVHNEKTEDGYVYVITDKGGNEYGTDDPADFPNVATELLRQDEPLRIWLAAVKIVPLKPGTEAQARTTGEEGLYPVEKAISGQDSAPPSPINAAIARKLKEAQRLAAEIERGLPKTAAGTPDEQIPSPRVGSSGIVKAESMLLNGSLYSRQTIKNNSIVWIRTPTEAKKFGENLIAEGLAIEEPITVNGRTINLILEGEIEREMGISTADIAALMGEAIRESGGNINNVPYYIVTALLDGSSHLFEDHISNGFVGINRNVNKITNEKVRRIILKVGLFHEFCHEVTNLQGDAFESDQFDRDVTFAADLMHEEGLSIDEFELAGLPVLLADGVFIDRVKLAYYETTAPLLSPEATNLSIAEGAITPAGLAVRKASISELKAQLADEAYRQLITGGIAGSLNEKRKLIMSKAMLGKLPQEYAEAVIQAMQRGGLTNLEVSFDISEANQVSDIPTVCLIAPEDIENLNIDSERIGEFRAVVINPLSHENAASLYQAIFTALALRGLTPEDVEQKNEKARAVVDLYNLLHPGHYEVSFEFLAKLINPRNTIFDLKYYLKQIIGSLPAPASLSQKEWGEILQAVEQAVENI